MRLKERLKQRAALVLSVMMALTCMPMGVLAEEVSTPSNLTTTEVVVIPVEEQDSEATVTPLEDKSPVETESSARLEEVDETVEESETEEISSETTSEPQSEEQTPAEEDEPSDDRHPLEIALEEHHCVYVSTVRKTKVYEDAALKGGLVYTTTSDIFLMLATDFTRYETVKVWFMDEEYQVVSGYVDADHLDTAYLLPEEANSINDFFACEGMTSVGWMSLFIVNGSYPEVEETPAAELNDVEATPMPGSIDAGASAAEESAETTSTDVQAFVEELQEEISVSDGLSEESSAGDVIIVEETADTPSDEEHPETQVVKPTEETPVTNVIADAGVIEEVPSDDELTSSEDQIDDYNPLEDSELQNEDDIIEEIATPSDLNPDETGSLEEGETSTEGDSEVIEYANPNDYIGVTTDTRVLSEVDETAVEDYYCDVYLGNIVKQATVQVLSVETDADRNVWYQVRFLYGDTFKNGTLKWTDYATAWVLASETCEPFGEACTVTDFAYTEELLQMSNGVSFYASAMDGFTLKNISGSIGSFYAGQTNLYGSSGKDSAYPQLAKSAGHGTIYATPHYLEGFTVYCLEHTLSGPGEGSGSSKTAAGPYTLVSLDEAAANGLAYKKSTMHALAWVLRHSYPFMALNRSDSNNEVWSRAAGQFAMREVIKQLEGSQYVRDYWDMDSFYTFTGGAPAVYLTYARWLASNGIARASISGDITVSNQSISITNGAYVGKMTLSTDADLIRIPKTVGTVTGNTGGENATYYYAQSGDIIQVTSSSSTFSVPMESISSDTEEANFLVGIPSASIQKVLVPVSGDPYVLQTSSVTFELTYGDITVTKQSSDGIFLQGAELELLDSNGNVTATAATDSSGTAAFTGIAVGSYKVREKTAPQGYQLGTVNMIDVSVTAGVNTTVTFTNERIRGVIQITKTDSMTGKALAGVVFTVTRLTAPESDHATDIGQVVATITTNENGVAQTDALPWGQYQVTETGVLDGYIDAGFETTVTIE